MRTIHKAAFLAPAAAMALILAGCGMGKPDSTVSQVEPTQTQSQSAEDTDSAEDVEVVEVQEDPVEADEETATKEAIGGQSATVGPVDASRTALGAHPGTQVVSVSLERVRGVSAWEVEVVSEEGQWEVSVDAVTGEIILDEVEHSDDLAEDLSLLAAASLDFEEAITAVLDAVPGGSLVELDLDEELGRPTWEGEVLSKEHLSHEVTIDAATGEVLQNEVDD